MGKTYRLDVPGVGRVKYTKIGDLTAAELNDALASKSISYTTKEGKLIQESHFQFFNENSAAASANASFIPEKGATNGVDLYKVSYKIPYKRNRDPLTNKRMRDPVTGLLAIPSGRTSTTMPLLSWQHGTVMSANEAPSGIMINDEFQRTPPGSTVVGQIRSTETLFNLVRLAGNGYVMAAADYNGNGDSTTAQYYAVKQPTIKATRGMISAAKGILSKIGIKTDGLFLNGWSQGGLNTLWLAESLRKSGITVTKQASSSTFSDLVKNADYWFNTFNGDPNWVTSAIPMLLAAYESYYNLKGLMKEAIKPEYLPIALAIQKGTIDWDKVPPPNKGEGLLGLPLTGKELLNEKFLNDYNNKRGRFYTKFKLNTGVMEEKYSHPTRFYGGGKDTAVAPGVSVEEPTAYFAPMSEGIHIGPDATHRSTFAGSLFGSALDPGNDIGSWFGSPSL